MATAGLRIAEVLQGLARTGRTTNQLTREGQALRGLREEADNIDDEHNMSAANSNNLEASNTILGKQSAKKSIHKRFRSKSMDFRVDEKKALPNM